MLVVRWWLIYWRVGGYLNYQDRPPGTAAATDWRPRHNCLSLSHFLLISCQILILRRMTRSFLQLKYQFTDDSTPSPVLLLVWSGRGLRGWSDNEGRKLHELSIVWLKPFQKPIAAVSFVVCDKKAKILRCVLWSLMESEFQYPLLERLAGRAKADILYWPLDRIGHRTWGTPARPPDPDCSEYCWGTSSVNWIFSLLLFKRKSLAPPGLNWGVFLDYHYMLLTA